MADVSHYIRARKWLDDPSTELPALDRAFVNAELATSTAMREVGSEIRQLSNRIEQCFDDAFGLTAGDPAGKVLTLLPRLNYVDLDAVSVAVAAEVAARKAPAPQVSVVTAATETAGGAE